MLPSLSKYLGAEQGNIRLGCIIGIGEVLLGLKGLSHVHQLHNEMKDSVFLKSLTQNEKKLIKAGEYMQEFKEKYKEMQGRDNFGEVNGDTIKEIVKSITEAIKEGKLYKGKSGENFRIYTLRLMECFAMCSVELSNTDIATFQVLPVSLRTSLSRTSKTPSNPSSSQPSNA
jgi:hypothetical protein